MPVLARAPADAFHRRLVGLYALTLMEREGPVHGYRVAERIAEQTEGAWRPGPGAVYPSLQKLQTWGLARSVTKARRREYTITPAGRSLLVGMRQRRGRFATGHPDLSMLWAEVMGVEGARELLLLRLRRVIDGLEAYLARNDPALPVEVQFRRDAMQLLAVALEKIERPAPQGTSRSRRGSR
ncbi:MAG: PadR family transcriptional regulator [Thermoplasmata archaeon]|nr:PadR family transcriptional regulator [Thermoplasmata archaeon]